MPTSTVPAVKKGVRSWLRTTLDAAGEARVEVRTGKLDPAEVPPEAILLTDVVAPQQWAGLGAQRKTEQPTMTCWINITKPGAGEDAVDAARDRAYQLLGIVEVGLRADPTAGGAIPNPNITEVAETALDEVPVDLNGAGGRLARLRFQLAWQSRI